jgi:murein DD-endopeptidase MepM/ murein hydrolase activator NlpD
MLKRALRLFPERQILVRAEGRVSYITLGRGAQIAATGCIVATLALLGYGILRWRHVDEPRLASLPPTPVAEPGPAPLSLQLQAEVEHLQRELAAVNAKLAQAASAAAVAPSEADLADAQARIRAVEDGRDHAIAEQKELHRQLDQLQEVANSRSQSLAQLNHTLESNRGEMKQSDGQRQTLQTRVRKLESELESANARTSQYKNDLASNERRLQQLAAEHDQTVAERNRLLARLSELQSRAAAPAQSGAIEPAPSSPRTTADRPSDQRSENRRDTGEIEQILAATGIDLEKLLGRLGAAPQGQGGPYVALDRAKRPAGSGARSEELHKIVKTLPLAAPLTHYQVESGFGGRPDPMNHKQAFHAGVDLSSPYRSPVYSTAPGTVIFTGVKDNYGKVVEIDHGNGIVTRYAHLHRIVAARGQKVPAHHQVGELGSTGRSTGPHLHYEVLVNGTAQDPEKFLQAGKNVVQASGN